MRSCQHISHESTPAHRCSLPQMSFRFRLQHNISAAHRSLFVLPHIHAPLHSLVGLLNPSSSIPAPAPCLTLFCLLLLLTCSNTTPAHPSSDFKWKDYSPKVFRNLRHLWGTSDADYMLTLGGSTALRQLNSPGKSGETEKEGPEGRLLYEWTARHVRTRVLAKPSW